MSDSEEDLGIQLKGLKIAKHLKGSEEHTSVEPELGLDRSCSSSNQDDLTVMYRHAKETVAGQEEEEAVVHADPLIEEEPAKRGTSLHSPEPEVDSNVNVDEGDSGLNRDNGLGLQDPFESVGDLDPFADTKARHGTNSDSDSDDGSWQEMPAISSFNIYNQRGELELTSKVRNPELSSDTPFADLPAKSSKSASDSRFDYTKMAAEQQAQRSYRTNRKTDFLFDHKVLKKKINSSQNSVNFTSSPSTTSLNNDTNNDNGDDDEGDGDDDDDSYDEYEDDVEPVNDLNRDSQLNITKNLLTDMEKFAYVGAINILANQMCTNLATLCLCIDIKSHKKLAHRLQFTQKDMAAWKTVVLSRLYDHLGISPEEIAMIEKLSLHKIQLEDLCKCLKTTQSIDNPWENDPDHDESRVDETIDEEPSNGQNDTISSGTPELEQRTGSSETPNARGSPSPLKVPATVLEPENVKNKDKLNIDVAWTIICDLFLICLQSSTYDSRSRTLLINFAKVLNMTTLEICEFERRVTDSLDMEQSTEDQEWDEQDHMKKRRKSKRRKKMAYVALAMVGGSLVLGLSGGLLAPVIGGGIAAGLSTIGIGGATGFLTGVGGTTVVAVSSTAIGANIGARGMSKRMGSVRTFEFRPLHNNRRVNLILTVSGWMVGNEDDVRLPFSTVDPVEGDLYSLYWEPEMLKSIGQTVSIVATEIFTTSLQQILGATVLTALISSIQWPMALSKLGYILDNPWNVSLDRAWSAGKILADTLIARNLGARPITLVGFSIGARVIFSCLIELCKKNALGLIENVYLFGTPAVMKKEQLVMARSVVSGRFVNGYSDKDWFLAYLFRAAAGGFSAVMGISKIEDVEGFENVNCTEYVDGHLNYRKSMPKLMKRIGITVLSEDFVEIEEIMNPEEVKRKRKLINDLDAAQKKLNERKKHNSWVPKWLKPKKSKWKVMVEEAVEEGRDMQDLPETEVDKNENENLDEPEEKVIPKRRDAALVDHGALMHELELIKAAMREDQLKEVELLAEDENKNKMEASTGYLANKQFEPPSTPKMNPPQSPNNFQLLSAGRTILPEDNEIDYRGKKKMEFSFPDDI
ncbi:YFL034W [Saccharomyces arboricola H-6]|uniref:YFL034W n=1 Tax=Saccharomyces arboricola (strain H-6 / AS 2.3317 / CBS 10644) TaxID=1160507 RepID=J8Q5L3_SACAR|nr:YFL034W [Saccharomyces arboricola H-6]